MLHCWRNREAVAYVRGRGAIDLCASSLRQVMTLQFDIQPLFKHVIEPCQIDLAAAIFYAVMNKTVGSAGKT